MPTYLMIVDFDLGRRTGKRNGRLDLRPYGYHTKAVIIITMTPKSSNVSRRKAYR
jgi:hypothetical protein